MALFHSFLWLSSIPLRGFAGGSVAKNPPGNAGDRGSISGLEIPAREGNGSQRQCSCPEKSHGQRRLTGYGPWSCKDSDRTEAAKQQSIPLYVHIMSTLLIHLVIDV